MRSASIAERDVELVGGHLEVELGVVVVRLAVHLRAEPRDDVVEAARDDISGVPRNIMCSSAWARPVLPGVSCSEPKPYQTAV